MFIIISQQIVHRLGNINVSEQLAQDALRPAYLFPRLLEEIRPVFKHVLKLFVLRFLNTLAMLRKIHSH